MQTSAKRMYSQFAECSLSYAKIMQTSAKRILFSICRMQLILCKDNRLFIYFVLIDLYQHKNFMQSIA